MKLKAVLIFLFATISAFSQIINASNVPELPFVVSICGYNIGSYVEKNLDSIFMQKYDNFRVIYIDDASSDGTAAKVQQYVDTHQLNDKVTFVINPTRCRKTKNMYNMFHTIADEEIIIQVDGDDWLAHDQVFAHINQVYQDKGVWLTYGQFIGHDNSTIGQCKPVPQEVITHRSFRSWQWAYTGLRTFYAWLFKNIKLEDFINERVPGFEGKFFPLSDDVLTYFSMLEMCGDRFTFIPEIHYIYNRANPLYIHRVEGNLYAPANKDIRSRAQYPQAQEPIINTIACHENAQADLIIVSKDNPGGLKILLDSLPNNITGIDTTYVLYEQSDIINKPYETLIIIYPFVQFIPTIKTTVSKALLDLLQKSNQEHILMAKDTAIALEPIDVHACIIELEKTGAYGFYFGFGHNTTPFCAANTNSEALPHEHIHNDMYAWKFECAPKNLCNNFTMTLLRKNIVLGRIAQLSNGTTIDSFIIAWQQAQHANMHNVGLFFKKIKLGWTKVISTLKI